ncbi:MAG: hypothetical protein IPJ31_08900 [Bacteroidetes bacterium]|nr:hypothetical protein [Bacteroidota bacterium]
MRAPILGTFKDLHKPIKPIKLYRLYTFAMLELILTLKSLYVTRNSNRTARDTKNHLSTAIGIKGNLHFTRSGTLFRPFQKLPLQEDFIKANPFYKLEGKLIFFKKQELDQWLLSNKVPCLSELEPPLKPSKKQVHD